MGVVVRGPKPLDVDLKHEEEKILTKWVRGGKIEHRLRFRAQIILLANEEKSNTEIAEILNCSRKTVVKWRNRFIKRRLDGLKDLFRAGRPPIYS
jgi:DNA-directed RNA polymerase specialized sigma subunit